MKKVSLTISSIVIGYTEQLKHQSKVTIKEKIGANTNNLEILCKLANELIRQKPKTKTVSAKLEGKKGTVEDTTAICNKMNNFFTEIGKN